MAKKLPFKGVAMIIIGICGASGSGKGYVCSVFEGHGVKWIDTDGVYKELTKPNAPCTNELAGFFGERILNMDGSLNRKELSRLVFQSENAEQNRKKLNEISHYHIRIRTKELITYYEEQGYKAVAIDAPVLFESGFDKMCDVTICVTAPQELKIERIMARDSITQEQALARLNSQLSDEALIELCDYEIKNTNGSDVEAQILAILQSLCL